MDLSRMQRDLEKLAPGERKVIYNGSDGTEVIVKQTAKLSPHDFAVGLVIPGHEEFYPTHIRLLIDLFIKRSSNAEDAHNLYLAFERVFNGSDPEDLRTQVESLKFPMKFDEPFVNLGYSQLLMIEQEINYGPGSKNPSKLNPPREFLMRFVRWTNDERAEIDKIIFAAVRHFPAPVRYSAPIS